MCGGFAALAEKSTLKQINNTSCSKSIIAGKFSSLLYNLGRLFTYLILGALVGVVGEKVNELLTELNISWIATYLIGILLAFVVLSLIFSSFESLSNKIPFFSTLVNSLNNKVKNLISFSLKQNKYKYIGPFLLGAATTLLPCGWLYANLSIALAQTNFTNSILVMFVFWLGTLPAMFSVSFVFDFLGTTFKRLIPKFTAVSIILAAIYSYSLHVSANNLKIEKKESVNHSSHKHCH